MDGYTYREIQTTMEKLIDAETIDQKLDALCIGLKLMLELTLETPEGRLAKIENE